VILEGIVTTTTPEGELHLAPMGPRVEQDLRGLELRPFAGSSTLRNLQAHGEGVFHLTDDVELIALAAIGRSEEALRGRRVTPARIVSGSVLRDACRVYEFRVRSIDTSAERARVDAEIVHSERFRDFVGFHRARHAVLEAAILATRAHLLPRAALTERLAALRVLVEKTGDAAEHRAFEILEASVRETPLPRETPPDEVVVRTGSRLHLGLIAPAGGTRRRFGGAGLMIAEPELRVRAQRAERWSASGAEAARVLEFARRFANAETPPASFRVETAPPSHSGLGSGTQLGLAVARALSALGGATPSPADLARQTGRGARSAIGLWGFAHGGFLVDAGRPPAAEATSEPAPLIIRHPVPEEWRFVVLIPADARGLSGEAERSAFASLAAVPAATVERLCETLLLGVLPALLERDLAGFGESLYAYGVLAGECFASVQGGPFLNARVAETVAWIRRAGTRGVGQSSWGPAVFAVCGDEGEARALADAAQRANVTRGGTVLIACPRNQGAAVEIPGAPSSHSLA